MDIWFLSAPSSLGGPRKRAMEQTAGRTTQTRLLLLAADSLAQEDGPMKERTSTTEEPARREVPGTPTQDYSDPLEM